MLDDALAGVAGEEEGVGAISGDSREPAKLGDAHVLRVVDDYEIEGMGGFRRESRGQAGKDAGLGNDMTGFESGRRLFEDRPQDTELIFGQVGVAESCDVAIGWPTLDLPGIDGSKVFVKQELAGKFIPLGRLHEYGLDGFLGGHIRLFELKFVEMTGEGIERVNFDTLGEAGLITSERAQFKGESVGQGIGESGKQNTGIWIDASEDGGAVQRNDGFASSGRTDDAGRAIIVALNDRALRRMKENGPRFPRIIESAFEFLRAADGAEPSLRVGMFEGVGIGGERHARLGLFTDGKLENGFGGFGRKMGSESGDGILAG